MIDNRPCNRLTILVNNVSILSSRQFVLNFELGCQIGGNHYHECCKIYYLHRLWKETGRYYSPELASQQCQLDVEIELTTRLGLDHGNTKSRSTCGFQTGPNTLSSVTLRVGVLGQRDPGQAAHAATLRDDTSIDRREAMPTLCSVIRDGPQAKSQLSQAGPSRAKMTAWDGFWPNLRSPQARARRSGRGFYLLFGPL